MKKILYFIPVVLISFATTSCKLDYFPSDELNAESVLSSEEGIKAIIDGAYSMLKDETDYLNYESGNSYVRHYFQLTEFPSDNVCNSNRTTDKLYEANTLTMTPDLNNIGVLWWVAYKVCFSANQVIENCKGTDATSLQYVGEAYFLRAMMHFHLVTLCAKPYTVDPNAMGVVLRLSTNTNKTERATVSACYEQIVKDLQKAAELMGNSRGNAGYASRNAALGLLSRVYLYMGENDKVIDVVTNQMGVSSANAASKLDPDFANYFRNAPTSKETLFCLVHTLVESRKTSSIGSMYTGDGGGWGEIYPSDPLLALYERYPNDVRDTAYIHPKISAGHGDTLKVYFAGTQDSRSRFCTSFPVEEFGESYKFIDGSTTYFVKKKKVNGEYDQWYVENFRDMGNLDARIMPWMLTDLNNKIFPMYWMTKFSFQDDDPMLSSPVFLRWGEVVLNLAEAYAKKGNSAEALKLVDVIRTRAGIPTEGMFTGNMHGYTDVLDIVLDERRMELAFEGHRLFDLIRNQRDIDRRYSGVHFYEVVGYNESRVQYPIPSGETTTSGIPQNPGY